MKKPLLVSTLVLTCGLAPIAIMPSPGGASTDPVLSSPCTDVARVATLGDLHLNGTSLGIDVTFFDGGTGVLNVNTADPVCIANPYIGALISQAVSSAQSLHADQCVGTKAFLASGGTTDHGVEVNMDAARQFVQAEC